MKAYAVKVSHCGDFGCATFWLSAKAENPTEATKKIKRQLEEDGCTNIQIHRVVHGGQAIIWRDE